MYENDPSFNQFLWTFDIAKESYNQAACVRDKLQAGATWQFVYPEGIQYLLNHIKEDYKDPTIYITENGIMKNFADYNGNRVIKILVAKLINSCFSPIFRLFRVQPRAC